MAVHNYLTTVEELDDALGDPGVCVIDCRFELLDAAAGKRSYDAGHVPGAVYADLDKDLAAPVGPSTGRHPLPDALELAETFAGMGIGSSSRVIVYDEGPGAVAARAWWLLRWLGHDNAALLDGGFSAWCGAGLPVETATPMIVRGDFAPVPRDELVLETPEIIAAEDRVGDLRLIDARASERFIGAVEAIDTVAGHIPGTWNLPYLDNVDEGGHWKSPAEIRRRLSEALGEPSGQPWAVMCGSGVTACHLVIAGLLGGFEEPRVYVGSWSEWISDPSRRIATGAA